jgi:anthraniloyl-CoA monooxygenase
MDVVCVGGGPGGLLLGILLRLHDRANRVTVLERNRSDDAFGFGVVFSDETLANIRSADPVSLGRIESEFRSWPDIDIVYGGRVVRSGGHGFAAIARRRLLGILTERATELGVEVRHGCEVRELEALRATHDLVVGADGANSLVRRLHAAAFRPSTETGLSRYIWLGTTLPLERFTFVVEQTPWGMVQAHAYPYADGKSSFIVETDRGTWERAGLGPEGGCALLPGESDPMALRFAESVFAAHLDGHPVLGNNSRWLEFITVSNERWHDGNAVLLGDAAHTAHFSIGSGTKMAMEDAIALAGALAGHPDLDAALTAYEAERRPVVASTQRAAHTSREWFEGIARYAGLDPEPFAFQMMTRSQRVTHDNLRLRDSGFVRGTTDWMWRTTPEHLRPADPATPPLFYPFALRGMRLENRVVVSPMAQYCAVDGLPSDWHLVHLGSRAVGGAGLVMTEMTCVSPEGRITPGCTGMWNRAQETAWARIVDFVHANTGARIGLQLGHSGRKGSTRVAWEGQDEPLDEGGWEPVGPSRIPYLPHSPVPRAMTRADMTEVREQFVAAARRGEAAGFDLLELHCAHGYLLSSFLSPITNRREDEYGGSPTGRRRFPLEVIAAVRDAWPDGRPLSVRISATDWCEGGFDGDDAVELAALLRDLGVDLVDVSTGQVDPAERPRHGRLWQTPFSDRIRHEVGMPTMAVGGIASVDDANTILLAGRADLVALARPHLVDPYWTLNAAIDLGHVAHRWPLQYLSGRTARRRDQDGSARLNNPEPS